MSNEWLNHEGLEGSLLVFDVSRQAFGCPPWPAHCNCISSVRKACRALTKTPPFSCICDDKFIKSPRNWAFCVTRVPLRPLTYVTPIALWAMLGRAFGIAFLTVAYGFQKVHLRNRHLKCCSFIKIVSCQIWWKRWSEMAMEWQRMVSESFSMSVTSSRV